MLARGVPVAREDEMGARGEEGRRGRGERAEVVLEETAPGLLPVGPDVVRAAAADELLEEGRRGGVAADAGVGVDLRALLVRWMEIEVGRLLRARTHPERDRPLRLEHA